MADRIAGFTREKYSSTAFSLQIAPFSHEGSPVSNTGASLDPRAANAHTECMDENERRLAESRARVFKAMAHPTRMRIISMLSQGPRNVGELTKAVGFDMSTVSKHLSILREAGVVLDETRGRSVYYSLYCTCIPEFLHCVDEIVLNKVCPRTWHYQAVRKPIRLLEV